MIGGAERLVVDAALGLQRLGHAVDIYTSHHDPKHCFDETRDGTLRVHAIHPPFPRHFRGKFHIFFSHAQQLHLITHILSPSAPIYDVYFVDQLSTCVPLLRVLGGTRVVFYCHFPDKLLAGGAYVEGKIQRSGGLLKRLYRLPMDLLEEITTAQADVILANSKFTARVFKTHFTSIRVTPRVVYPGINLAAYEATAIDPSDPDVVQVLSDRPTLLSLNRFEKKKNAALAIDAFAKLRTSSSDTGSSQVRLVIAGGYDPRLEDNMMTLVFLIDRAKANSLTFDIINPASSQSPVRIPPFNTTPASPDVLFLLNFTTPQRSALLTSPSTLALLYTPSNEHFGIGPVEAMVCGVPVLACDNGGPTESVIDPDFEPRSRDSKDMVEGRTGWLRKPDPEIWATALREIVALSPEERRELSSRALRRAREMFGMEAMARDLDDALKEAVDMGPPPYGIWTVVSAILALMGLLVGILTRICA
ncbi:alpha-1,3-mannosyltransferase ALG2 [Cristinia sonorae]|uniref:Alpha-1,3/1,6-mannosyltransferase ALG2 n=1 Tax=Cristinia sonorae TaxID=1940300 RepID=A0A8K0XPQ5_9AGAR|nr:alpha-1,3-mannosyltransferase ALG2 [Cristinia sonorae]